MSKVRMNIEVSSDLAEFLDQLAIDEGATRTEMIRRAVSILKAYKSQKARGRTHIGFAADPNGLDAELVGILDA
jgi:metal-responsive CopG/Arc/MetJ family transcriptional regulator